MSTSKSKFRPKKKTVKALSRRVARLEHLPEIKAIRTELATTYGSTGSVNQLSVIAQGDASNSRDGNKVSLRGYSIRGRVAAGAAIDQIIRLVLLVDKQNDNVAPLTADILDMDGTNDVYAPMNHANRHRFRVLKEKYFKVNTGSYETTGSHVYRMSGRLGNTCLYKANAASDYLSGNVWLLILTNTVGSHPTVYMQSQITFTDS